MPTQTPPTEQGISEWTQAAAENGGMAASLAVKLGRFRADLARRRQELARRFPAQGKRYAFAPPSPETAEFWSLMAVGELMWQAGALKYPDEVPFMTAQRRAIMTLGREFLQAAEHGNAVAVQSFVEESFDVNWQEPQTGETALHVAAASQARGVLRVLLAWGRCDFLRRDAGERLASELAYLIGHDPAVARLLGIKERKQAAEKGITLARRPRTSP